MSDTPGYAPAEMFDTHCHIQSAGLVATDDDRGEKVTRAMWAKSPGLTADSAADAARDAGVTRMICVGCDLADSLLAIEFATGRPDCWSSIGIHPHEARHYAPHSEGDRIIEFAELARKPKVVAVGECGLDYHYGHSPKADQIKVLEFQIDLALEAGLPLIFHVREAFDDFWPVFDRYDDVRGVLHSFTDSRHNLDKALERGLYIGVNGIATFAKDPGRLEVYKAVPLDKLLLETDAPFLTPTPYRGNVNEPKRLGAVADFLARLRGEDLDELVKATTENARKLFSV